MVIAPLKILPIAIKATVIVVGFTAVVILAAIAIAVEMVGDIITGYKNI